MTASRRALSAIGRSSAGVAELAVVRGDHDGVGVEDRVAQGLGRRGHVRVVDRDVGQLALQQADELVRRASRARRRCRALKARPSTATLRPSSEPRRRLRPSTRNSGTDSLHARDGQQHARGACERSSEKAKSLRRHVPAVKPGCAHPAARVVAVDEVDDLEHVGAVLLALHHQPVGQREHRVAQDVRPDLGQLGLDGRGLARSARRSTANSLAAASPERSPTPPTMHGSVPISSKNRPAAIRSGTWATKMSSPDDEARGAWPGSRRRTRSCPGAMVERRTSEWPGRRRPAAGRRARRGCRACRSRCATTPACRA